MKADDPAFAQHPHSDWKPEPGIDIRTYLAGQAMVGVIQNGEAEDYKHNAIVAVRNADALIDELQKINR